MPGCVLAFIKQSVRTSVIESVNEETAIKDTTEGLLYRVNSLRVGQKPSNSFPLPPATALGKPLRLRTWKKKSSTAVWLPRERSVSMATPSCRHSCCSCWKSTSAVNCLIRSFTMFTHSYRHKYTKAFVKPQHRDIWLINRIHFHWSISTLFTCIHLCWPLGKNNASFIDCWFSHIGWVTLTMDTSAPVEF